MKSIGAIAAALLLAAWIGLLPAKAQDPGSAPVQTGIEALFVIDEAAQHVTLYVRGLFRPLPGPVLWAVPLPAPPAEVAWLHGADTAFSILDEDTQPVIEAPFPGACALAPQLVFGDGYLPWPWISEAIGHDDDADATPLILPDPDALRAHAGQIAAPLAVSEAALAALPAGWVYAALPVAPGPLLQDDFWASHFVEATPVLRAVFPYDGPEALAALLALPLAWRAAALEAVLINDLRPDALTVTVYIAAGTAYALADAPLASVDLKAVPGGYDWIAHILTDVVGPEFFFGSLRPGYDALVVEALAVDPPSFVREFVGPPALSTGIPTLADRPDARRILDQVDAQPVLTRLYALYPADRPDVRAYPVIRFAPDPSAVPGHLDYTAAVDPAWFFTCTTRRLDDPALAARLPAGRTRIDALRLDIAHPPGWMLTTVAPPAGTGQSAPIYVLAPADAPPDHLARLEAGAADGPPALAMQAFAGPYVAGDEYSLAPPDPSERPFTRAADAALPPGIARLSAVRYFPTARADDSHDVPFAEGVRIALIGPAADLAANRSLYQAMLDHLLRYPYLLDPALRHTLFEGDLRTLIALGYPEDWLEVIVDGARWILPRAALGLPADAPVGDTRGLMPVTDRTPWVRLHRFRNADDLAALLAR
ncbi:MAG: hypothetical protein NZM00_14065, partial [Anaerolinea sp.]|nr:hypothetical protein [Anaerolinea sp.]